LIASKATSALNSLVNFLRSRFILVCNFGFNLAFFKSSFSRPHHTSVLALPIVKCGLGYAILATYF
jgi:hypothetical protein